MWSSTRWPRSFVLLLALVGFGCAHDSASSRGEGEGEGEGDQSEGGGGGDDGEESEPSSVKLRHKALPDVVEEKSDSGRPRKDPESLRQSMCEGYETEPKIFYHLIVSTHWHYYWICSDNRPHRVSSRRGKRSLEEWLRGFKKQAEVQSQDCAGSGTRKALTGNHESGIQAVAFCDGRIQLAFPDGGRTQTSFRVQAGAPPVAGGGGGGGGGDDGGETSTNTCPPCPSPPPVRGRSCPECPVCTPCPPPRSCPPRSCPACPACPPPRACPACPACDCSKAVIAGGQKAFRQGVDKACKRICDLIYKRCRGINPNTALCYQLSEFCATECIK